MLEDCGKDHIIQELRDLTIVGLTDKMAEYSLYYVCKYEAATFNSFVILQGQSLI